MMKLNSETRNVLSRTRKEVINTSDCQKSENLRHNTNLQDAAYIEEIKNEYKTIPPEYLQSPRKPKVSFTRPTRQMSLG